MIEAAANLLLLVLTLVCGWIWIRSLVNWDGKCPCRLEDCEICPYAGACDDQEKLIQLREEEDHE